MLSHLPEHHGLASKDLLAFFEHVEQLELELNSFMLLQNGHAAAQFWRYPYRQESPQLLYSLSKSFTSIAVGIAWDNGLLRLDDPVISFFPGKLPREISTNLSSMTVHHLLSMTAGHQEDIYPAVARERDWVQAFLSLPVEHEPGRHYRYSTHSTYMLAAILEQVTGQGLVDYLMPRLFEPLGIPRPAWETCPMGIAAGGMGLSLSTGSIAKFGQMLLDGGMFGGKRIVSEAYVRLASAEQSDNRDVGTRAGRIDSAQGYGYQFHRCRRGCYRGDGSFGQLCFVAPHAKIVIAATASFPSMNRLQTLLDLIYEHILDRLDGEVSFHPEDNRLLNERLAAYADLAPALRALPAHAPKLRDSWYVLQENPHGLHRIRIAGDGPRLNLELHYLNGRESRLPFHVAEPMQAQDRFYKDLTIELQTVVTYAAWRDANTLELTLYYIETPYVATYTLIFRGTAIELRFRINVSLNVPDYVVTGTRHDSS